MLVGRIVAWSFFGAAGAVAKAASNVVMILADDKDFSDRGSDGGEIDTPTFDRLATQSEPRLP